MAEPIPESPPSARPSGDRLDSWKEIATYLHRDVTTVQRWERREGMPVHRHLHGRQGSVYAFPSEIDAWIESRRAGLEAEELTVGRNERTTGDQERTGEPSPLAQAHPAPSFRAGHWLVFGVLAVVAILATAYVLARRSAGPELQPKINSLAVLPLKNLSADVTQEYLADGMTESLIGRLSGIHNLRVVSRTSVMRFKESPPSVPEIAKILNVDAVVEGSVIREGNRIRVHAQLIRAATDEHFWSETYDRELDDVLSLESDIAQSIAAKVEVTVTGEERNRLAAARPISPPVYENYLKGRFALEKAGSKADIEESLQYFNKSINADPTFAPAYIGLAAAYRGLTTAFGGVPPQELRPKIMGAARAALEIDPQSVEALVLLANMQLEQWQWDEAEAGYKRALELNPNSAEAQGGQADWLLTQGRTDEALSWARRAQALDGHAVSTSNIGWILFSGRLYDEATRELQGRLTAAPNDVFALSGLAFVLMANHQPNEAVPLLEKAVLLSDRSPAMVGGLASAYARAGRRTEATRLLAELKKRQREGFVPAPAFINAYLGLGEYDQAFVWLEQGYKEQAKMLKFMKVHPFFDPIRGDPRFVDLLHRIGLDKTR